MPRHLRGTTRKTSLISSCAGWLPSRRTARLYWFSTSARPASSCCTRHQDALQNVQRLKAGDHDRHVVFLRQRNVFLVAHHRADVAGGEKRLHPAVGRGHERLDRRRHEHVRDEHGKVLQPLLRRPETRPWPWPARWFQSRRRRRPPARRVVRRDLHRVQRRINDAHVARPWP